MLDNNKRIKIFDTSLRDGEQAPGASLNIFEKVEIAKQLIKLNVDIIEAGFPVSSKEQYDSVRRIADLPNRPIIAALARAIDKDIKSAASALGGGKQSRIHTFIGTSDIHIEGKFSSQRYGINLKQKRQTVLKMACDAVMMAGSFTDDIEFSAEDAGRTDIGFLAEIIEAVISSGASTVNIPDTTGYTMPLELGEKIIQLKERVSNINDSVISVHCHNDLGLAVANSLSAIASGARQVECTVNGIGERAGNASMEEIVMALKVRDEYWGYFTDINIKEIYPASRMISNYTGMIVQPNKALVGENAFAHESGIHQDGVLKNRQTYEIINPESIGIRSNKIILGRHSGRHGLKARLSILGYELTEESLSSIYSQFLELADKKKEIFDDDLRALMGENLEQDSEFYSLEYLHVNVGTTTIPTAVVRIKAGGKLFEESATGDGPVAACFRAVKRAVTLDNDIKLEHYQVRSVTSGKGALGEVALRLKIKDGFYTGKGISTDTIEASCKAYLDALNQFEKIKTLGGKTFKIPGI